MELLKLQYKCPISEITVPFGNLYSDTILEFPRTFPLTLAGSRFRDNNGKIAHFFYSRHYLVQFRPAIPAYNVLVPRTIPKHRACL